jgi:hypothetical protein
MPTSEPGSIAKALRNGVFVHIGLPKTVHLDNETTLIDAAMPIVFAKLGVRRTRSTVRHPQAIRVPRPEDFQIQS